MKKQIKFLFPLFVLSCLAAVSCGKKSSGMSHPENDNYCSNDAILNAPLQQTAGKVIVTETDNGKSIAISVGETFFVKMAQLNAGTGFSWHVYKTDGLGEPTMLSPSLSCQIPPVAGGIMPPSYYRFETSGMKAGLYHLQFVMSRYAKNDLNKCFDQSNDKLDDCKFFNVDIQLHN